MLQFVTGDYNGARRSIDRAVEDTVESIAVQEIQLAGTAIPIGLLSLR
jgi:hypothetical protein